MVGSIFKGTVRSVTMKKHTFDDFKKICNITEKDLRVDVAAGESYCVIHCFRISHSGAWVIKPDQHNSSEDIDYRVKLSGGDYSKPLLRFPCSRKQIKNLLSADELSSRIVPAQSFHDENGKLIPVPLDKEWISLKLDELLYKDSSCTEEVGKKKEGRHPNADLTEAVEYLYKKFYNRGDREILRPGKVQEFLKRMKDATIEDGQNFSDYIAERIYEVKKKEGKLIVTTQIGRPYSTNAVSKRLTKQREKMPL
jgi:hypothetical protein